MTAVLEERRSVEELREDWARSDLSVVPRSYWKEVGHRFLRNRTGMAAALVLFLICLSAAFAPVLAPKHGLIGNTSNRLANVGSKGHLLGSDEQGRDMLTRLLYGGRLSLVAGFVPVAGATFVGMLLGMMAGLSRGGLNTIIMRTMDMLYAFPAVLLAIAVSTSLGPGPLNAMIATTFIFIPPICRIAETTTKRVALQEYVEAARLAGARGFRMIRTQVFPNVLNGVLAYASGLLGISMIIAASLSFLGLGVLPPAPEWGSMLQSLRASIYDAALVSVLPGLMIFITSISFNMLADGVRDAMNVRQA